MTVKTLKAILKNIDDDKEIIILYDSGYGNGSPIEEYMVDHKHLFLNIDINDAISESVNHYQFNAKQNPRLEKFDD